MKKLLTVTMALAMSAAALAAFAACAPAENDNTGNNGGGNGGGGNAQPDPPVYTVYAPDGAPALALANAIDKSTNGDFEFHIVASSTITAQVTGDMPAADFCVLPVNAAAKLLGSGETYQMLGTVTNGNMYFLTTGDNASLTTDNLDVLVGKTVGVVQLSNVPGLTFQTVLKANNLDYQILSSEVEAADDMVNLQPIQDAATGVTPAGGCDYYLCPEPAASAKIKGTAASANPFKLAGSLQNLYGDGTGYPQAVLVAKTSVIEDTYGAAMVEEMIGYMEGSAQFLAEAEASEVVALLEDKYTEGMTPSLNANNLTSEVIANCSVRFTPAQECKERVNAFLAELIAISPDFTSAVDDAFYYAP